MGYGKNIKIFFIYIYFYFIKFIVIIIFKQGENPIYKQATSTFKNPTYAGK